MYGRESVNIHHVLTGWPKSRSTNKQPLLSVNFSIVETLTALCRGVVLFWTWKFDESYTYDPRESFKYSLGKAKGYYIALRSKRLCF